MGRKPGSRQTEASRRKISETLKATYTEGRRKRASGMQGKRHSADTIEKMRATAARRKQEGAHNLFTAGHARTLGVKHPAFKGDDAGYQAIHAWIRRRLGSPSKCERCGTTIAKRYEWANISGRYSRDPSDWTRLCKSCHNIFDGPAEKSLRGIV